MAQHHTGALPYLSASFIPPGVCSPRPRGSPGVGTGRAPLRRVADLLRLREACESERARTDQRLALLTALPHHEEVSGAMVRPAVNHFGHFRYNWDMKDYAP